MRKQPSRFDDPIGYNRWMAAYMRAYRASPLYTDPWTPRERAMLKHALAAYRGQSGCQRCGSQEWARLGWHHRDPETKRFSIGTGHARSGAALLAEVEKCDLVCRKCHRLTHWERARLGLEPPPKNGWPKGKPRKLAGQSVSSRTLYRRAQEARKAILE